MTLSHRQFLALILASVLGTVLVCTAGIIAGVNWGAWWTIEKVEQQQRVFQAALDSSLVLAYRRGDAYRDSLYAVRRQLKRVTR